MLCTGDLLVHDVANLIDGYVNEWPDALEKLKPIDFVDVIPGHGEPFKGKERIDWFQAYLRDLWKQGSALHEQKVAAADAAKRIDMTAHKAHYPAITAPGVNLPAVSRMYEVMEGRADAVASSLQEIGHGHHNHNHSVRHATHRCALALDPVTYEEVEADRSATGQALLVVVLSSVGAGIGARGLGSGSLAEHGVHQRACRSSRGRRGRC